MIIYRFIYIFKDHFVKEFEWKGSSLTDNITVLNILQNGTIKTIDGVEEFPDFPSGSKIVGTISSVIPQKVTT